MTVPARSAGPDAAVTLVIMGFNPFREQRRSVFDVVLVAVAVAATLALLAWGFFGG